MFDFVEHSLVVLLSPPVVVRASYQKNTNNGKLKGNSGVKILENEKPVSNNKYEEDLKKEATDPILNDETP